MLGARPEPLNLSLPPQLTLDLAPSAPPARAGSCLGAKQPFLLGPPQKGSIVLKTQKLGSREIPSSCAESHPSGSWLASIGKQGVELGHGLSCAMAN
jgi:hypothetical protein